MGALEHGGLELLTLNPRALLATQPRAPPAGKTLPLAPAPAPITLNWKNSGEPTGWIMNMTTKKKIGGG